MSPLLALAPLLIPLLGGVWILRILARLFSENVKTLQDARERVTLVTTFLALMRDEKNGKVVTDDDRKIILQALFRQSSVTASDDAPPFSLWELLSRSRSGPPH